MTGPMAAQTPVRVRFAPSPTGRLHIGGARTALFNWAYARSRGGVFVLRIEDTDTERNSQESLDSILDSMRWLGLDWDEGPGAGGAHGPYCQSERRDHYDAAVTRGLEEGWLYRCFASDAELAEMRAAQEAAGERPHYDGRSRDLPAEESAARAAAGDAFVVRFRVPEGEEVVVRDHIRGEVRFASEEVEDWVVVRTNGMPTYNFVCAIDDAAMEITHVIRGEEHLVNTPKQVLLYRALGLQVPEYAHVPLILGADGKKLSKRTGDTAVGDYRDKGYPPEALFNFLCLLGFAIDDKTTVFGREELLAAFDLGRISKGGAVFDVDKLHWLCGDYVRHSEPALLLDRVLPWLQTAGFVGDREADGEAHAWLLRLVDAFRERITLYGDLPEQVAGFFADAVEPDEAAGKALSADDAATLLAAVAAEVEEAWPPQGEAPADFAALLKAVAEKQGVKLGQVMKPTRAALTGRLGGPDLAAVIALLGRDRSLGRLRAVAAV